MGWALGWGWGCPVSGAITPHLAGGWKRTVNASVGAYGFAYARVPPRALVRREGPLGSCAHAARGKTRQTGIIALYYSPRRPPRLISRSCLGERHTAVLTAVLRGV